MKFCKNLQRVVEISDPEWAPYWTNYKMLKKLIKELPSLVPGDDRNNKRKRSESIDSAESTPSPQEQEQQQHGDKTTERKQQQQQQQQQEKCPQHHDANHPATPPADHGRDAVAAMNKSPGEVAFFKLLHAEYKKTTQFFETAQQEFVIREERVRRGMEIMKQPNSIMVNEKWSLLAKSLYRLYKDLLLLETYAIMTYCSFSKILKKHDKVTGYNTRNAFMANVVNKANFTNYPIVLQMINRCEKMYEEVSKELVREGKEGLYEDERLFINMIHRLNEHAMGTAEGEGAPEREEVKRPAQKMEECYNDLLQKQTASLRSIVSDINKSNNTQVVSEGHTGDEESSDSTVDRKRDEQHRDAKKQRTE